MVWAHRHAALLLLRALGLPCLRDHLLRLAPHVLHVAGEVGLLDGVEVGLLDGVRAADRTRGFQPLLLQL